MGDLKYMGDCAWVPCKYHAIVYRRLEHVHILVSVGDLKSITLQYPGVTIYLLQMWSYSYIPYTWLYPNKLKYVTSCENNCVSTSHSSDIMDHPANLFNERISLILLSCQSYFIEAHLKYSSAI